VVHVANRAHVHVGLGPFEFFFCHLAIPLKKSNARVSV